MAIIYYIFKVKVWLLSKLPMKVLYFFSDLLAFFLRDIIRYRKQVIYDNLSHAFPEKKEREIRSVANEYYRNLADVIMEIIKWRSISREKILRRFRFENMEIMDQALREGKSVIIAIGHCGNWEWMGTALGLLTPQKGYAVVKPLSDKRFNNYMRFLRHRLNNDSTIPFKDTFRFMLKENRKGPFFAVFAADQTPTRDEIGFWMKFMGRDTGFFLGIEKIARALDMTVIFVDIRREKRGYYKGVMSLITKKPKEEPELGITMQYVRKLERSIRNNPANWLWSHRRWKHAPSENDHVYN